MEVGIDAIQFDIPKLYLSIQELAENRNIESRQTHKRIGITKDEFFRCAARCYYYGRKCTS